MRDLDCKFEMGKILQYQRGKLCKCESCMDSLNGSNFFDETTKNHIDSKWCKHWTQCQKCTELKYHYRLLLHTKGCTKTKKHCTLCKEFSYTVVNNPKTSKHMSTLVKRIYYAVLRKRVKWKFP